MIVAGQEDAVNRNKRQAWCKTNGPLEVTGQIPCESFSLATSGYHNRGSKEGPAVWTKLGL